MKTRIIHTFVFLVGAIVSWVNMCYFADKIGKFSNGYFVALGVVPFFYGLLISYIGFLVLGKGVINGIVKEPWAIFISGELGAFLPIVYVIFVLS